MQVLNRIKIIFEPVPVLQFDGREFAIRDSEVCECIRLKQTLYRVLIYLNTKCACNVPRDKW